MISITFLQYIYVLYKRYPLYTIFFSILIILIVSIKIDTLWARGSCEKWDKGLKGTVMRNDGKGCEIPVPEFCFHELTSEWFDLSRILGKDQCHNSKDVIKIGQGDLLGYPKTQFFDREEKFMEKYQNHVLGLVKEIKNEEINNGTYEVFLNQSNLNQPPTLNIQVHYNQTLAKRSHSIISKKPPLQFQNILTIFLDSVSRQHFARKLPKTLKFIEDRYQSPDTTHEAFQFFKYHASGSHTLPNMMRAFYGVDFRTPDGAQSLIKTFKEQGYITAKSGNICQPAHFDVSLVDTTLKDLIIEQYDHENVAFSCDPNYRLIDGDGPDSNWQGSSAMLRRCLYGREVFEYVIEYGEKFWNTYRNEPKILELGLLDGHEPSAEVVKYLDEPLVKFLEKFESQGLLKDTTLIFYSDHGHHLNFFYYLFGLKDLMYELKLPMMFILFPRNLADIYGNYMKNLENVLISGYDIYNFYKTMVGSRDRIQFGINFFEKVDFGRGWRDLDLEENIAICQNKYNEDK